MTTTNQELTESPMVRRINRDLLKYAVGHAVFCPACQNIMDYRRAVLVTVSRGSDTLVTKCLCAKCWDPKQSTFTAAMVEKGLSVELVDGRKYK